MAPQKLMELAADGEEMCQRSRLRVVIHLYLFQSQLHLGDLMTYDFKMFQ